MARMLFLHEHHRVAGAREAEFEAAYRDGWLPALAGDTGARLLWFLHLAPGTGPSYRVVTITAFRDAAAWQRAADRVESGDLAPWARSVAALRHDVRAKLMTPLDWSPLRELDLDSVPTEGATHEPSVYMEDTVWPYPGRLQAYLEAAGSHYSRELAERGDRALLRIEAAFRSAFGSARPDEVVLWQKIVQPRALLGLITREIPAEHRKPGTWMHDALELRDQWESRLLRTAAWSPLH